MQETINLMISLHNNAFPKWKSLYKTYFNINYMPYMKIQVERLVNIIKDIFLTPSLETEDTDILNELKVLTLFTKNTLLNFNKDIKIAMQDGVITNNGILHVYFSKKNKLIIRRRDPFSIVYFEDLQGELFVIDRNSYKCWTEDHIYFLDNNYKIIKSERNYYKLIPFIQYSPHRIEIGGTAGRRDSTILAGIGAEDLENIQIRLNEISEMKLDTLDKITDPLYAYTGNITPEIIQNKLDTREPIKLTADDKMFPLESNNSLALNVLEGSRNETRNTLNEMTGQTGLTMGTSTSTSASTSLVKEHKSAMMINLRDYEDAYIILYTSIVKLIITLKSYNDKSFEMINPKEIIIKKHDNNFDNTQYITLLQNITAMFGNATEETMLDLVFEFLQPQVMAIASQSADPESFIRKIKTIVEKRKSALNQMKAQQEQQLAL